MKTLKGTYRLTQIKRKSLRTKSAVGKIAAFPHVNVPFLLIGPPLTGGSVRIIRTSPVTSSSCYGWKGSACTFWVFHTQSGSIYKLEEVSE